MEKIKQCISSVKSHFTDYTANQSFLPPKQLKMIYSVERAKYFISPKKVEKIKQLIEKSSTYNQNTSGSTVSNVVLDSILDSVDPKIYQLLNINKNYTGNERNNSPQPTKKASQNFDPWYLPQEQNQNVKVVNESSSDFDFVFEKEAEEDAERNYLQFLQNEENPLDQVF